MRKFLAILFSIVILATLLAVPAFAAVSPEGDIIEDDDVVVDDTDKNESDKAPQTGDDAVMMVAFLTAGAFVTMAVTRKAIKA